MIELTYSLVIEASEEPDFFWVYSLDLEGFSGIGTPCKIVYNTQTEHEGSLGVARETGVSSSPVESGVENHPPSYNHRPHQPKCSEHEFN